MNKEHALHVDTNYSYKDRLRNWRKYSTRNKIPFDCKECNKTHAYKTVYLDTGEHVCWFCWIRKDHVFHNAVHKPQEIVRVEKPKVKSQVVKKPIEKPKVDKPIKESKPEIIKIVKPIKKNKVVKKAVVKPKIEKPFMELKPEINKIVKPVKKTKVAKKFIVKPKIKKPIVDFKIKPEIKKSEPVPIVEINHSISLPVIKERVITPINKNEMDAEKYYDNIKHRFFTSYKSKKNNNLKNNKEDK